MALTKSVVMSSLLPAAEADAALYEAGLQLLLEKGIHTVETFIPFEAAKERGKLLQAFRMNNIYLAAMYQKRHGFDLCAVDRDAGELALRETFRCLEAAAASGSARMLITSGHLPERESDIPEATKRLTESVMALCRRAWELGVHITLEPGDTTVQACQLLGPTTRVCEWMQGMTLDCPNLSLTMDMSHTMQLGEDIKESFRMAKNFTSHVHIANCILKPGHPLYGDRHPMLSDPDAFATLAELQELARWTEEELMADRDFIMAFEIICHGGDNLEFMKKVLEEEQWFL